VWIDFISVFLLIIVDDATEILEYSVNVPVRQKSASRLPTGLLQRGNSTLDAKPPLNREQSGFTSATKPPASPRHEPVASEIPSGIVSRASMSLRRASTIMDTKEEKATVGTLRTRQAKPSVLSRAPSQVTERDSLTTSGASTPSTARQRPQSIAVPLSSSTLSPRPSNAKMTPKGSPSITPRPATPKASSAMNPISSKAANTSNINGSGTPNGKPPVVAPKPKQGAVPRPLDGQNTIAAVNAKPNTPAKPNIPTKFANNIAAKPATAASNNQIETLTAQATDATTVDSTRNHHHHHHQQSNGSAHSGATDDSLSQQTSTGPEELSFEFVQPAEPLPVSDMGIPNDIFVEPTPSPVVAEEHRPPNHQHQQNSQKPISREASKVSPSTTARLTVEDAKPLLMRENSVPVHSDEGPEFVFDAAATEASPNDDRTAASVAATNVVDDNTSTVDDQASPRTKGTKVGTKPDAPSKKPSKRAKPQSEVVSAALPTPVPHLSPANSTSDPIAIRGRAKTRKILGGDSSIGTPFYSTTDVAYLPRKIQNVPLMRLTSKRFLMTARTESTISWKTMFSPDNLALMPSGAYQGYAEHFQNEDHINFIGEDHVDGGFVLVSLLKKATADTDINCIIRTKDGDAALLIPIPDKKPKDNAGWLSLLRKNADFASIIPKKIALQAVNNTQFTSELTEVESKLDRTNYKFGVVYCKENQTEEEEYFSNEHGSPEFEEFLAWIGDRIPLQGWTKYDGGLDTQKNATGTHSIYTEWKKLNIMFHVSTMLPMLPKGAETDDSDQEHDDRTQEKKVHIGNDIVLIIFLEGEGTDTTFNPRKFVSHFNHAFIVVNPVRQKGLTLYRINTIYKSEVQPCLPAIPADAIFEKSDRLRDLLLTKLVNSERASCLAEQFASSLASLRYHTLYNAGKKYQAKPSAGCFAGCAGKK
jgi:hypothetical protein